MLSSTSTNYALNMTSSWGFLLSMTTSIILGTSSTLIETSTPTSANIITSKKNFINTNHHQKLHTIISFKIKNNNIVLILLMLHKESTPSKTKSLFSNNKLLESRKKTTQKNQGKLTLFENSQKKC